MAKKINFGTKVIIGQSRFGRFPFISNENVNMPSVAKILPELSTIPIFNPCTTTPCTPYQMTIYNRPTLHPLSLSLTPNLFRDPGEGNRNIDLWRETSSLPTYLLPFLPLRLSDTIYQKVGKLAVGRSEDKSTVFTYGDFHI